MRGIAYIINLKLEGRVQQTIGPGLDIDNSQYRLDMNVSLMAIPLRTKSVTHQSMISGQDNKYQRN